MCLGAIWMRAGPAWSMDVKCDAYFFSVGATDGAVRGLCPCWFAISEFGSDVPVVVMFADGMVEFATEDAADRVTRTLSTALRK